MLVILVIIIAGMVAFSYLKSQDKIETHNAAFPPSLWVYEYVRSCETYITLKPAGLNGDVPNAEVTELREKALEATRKDLYARGMRPTSFGYMGEGTNNPHAFREEIEDPIMKEFARKYPTRATPVPKNIDLLIERNDSNLYGGAREYFHKKYWNKEYGLSRGTDVALEKYCRIMKEYAEYVRNHNHDIPYVEYYKTLGLSCAFDLVNLVDKEIANESHMRSVLHMYYYNLLKERYPDVLPHNPSFMIDDLLGGNSNIKAAALRLADYHIKDHGLQFFLYYTSEFNPKHPEKTAEQAKQLPDLKAETKYLDLVSICEEKPFKSE